jgi:hypothetical protein
MAESSIVTALERDSGVMHQLKQVRARELSLTAAHHRFLEEQATLTDQNS